MTEDRVKEALRRVEGDVFRTGTVTPETLDLITAALAATPEPLDARLYAIGRAAVRWVHEADRSGPREADYYGQLIAAVHAAVEPAPGVRDYNGAPLTPDTDSGEPGE